MLLLYKVGGVVVVLAALLSAAYVWGGLQERSEWERKALEDYSDTRERIDNATDGLDTPSDIDERLRQLAE